MDNIKVLWMNNGDESLLKYIEEASIYGIMITPCSNTANFKEILGDKSKVWDALILNAEVKPSSNIKPSVDHLGAILNTVRTICKDNPCYVVTTDVKLDNNKSWKRRTINTTLAIGGGEWEFYVLGNENIGGFYEAIQKRVENNPEYKVRKKYAEVCNFCSEKLLLDLLIKYEFEEIDSDTEIPNQCRKVLEWTKNNTLFNETYLSEELVRELREHYKKYNKRFPYTETYSQLTPNDFSYALDKSAKVPEFVKRSLHSCISTSNRGSHYSEIQRMLEYKEVPYLNKSLIYELLNILHWCALQDKETFEL